MAWEWIKSNLPTILAIGGLAWYTAADNATMKAKMDESERYRTSRSVLTDGNFDKVNRRIDTLSDLPLRVAALEEQQKALVARLDRIADAVTTGQERLRGDFAQATDAIRKDVAGVVTKVEVLSDRLGVRQQRTSLPIQERGG